MPAECSPPLLHPSQSLASRSKPGSLRRLSPQSKPVRTLTTMYVRTGERCSSLADSSLRVRTFPLQGTKEDLAVERDVAHPRSAVWQRPKMFRKLAGHRVFGEEVFWVPSLRVLFQGAASWHLFMAGPVVILNRAVRPGARRSIRRRDCFSVLFRSTHHLAELPRISGGLPGLACAGRAFSGCPRSRSFRRFRNAFWY